MSAGHTVTRPRRGRAALSDVRFFIGLALVALSVLGVWLVISAGSRAEPAYQAVRTIVPGDVIEPGDVRQVDVVLGDAREGYVSPAHVVEGAIANRTIAAGELVPATSLDPGGSRAEVTTLVITSATALPSSVQRGSLVELWAAEPTEQGRFGAPELLIQQAVVSTVTAETGMLSNGEARVEIVLARGEVARTLEAMADGSAISIVPTIGAASEEQP